MMRLKTKGVPMTRNSHPNPWRMRDEKGLRNFLDHNMKNYFDGLLMTEEQKKELEEIRTSKDTILGKRVRASIVEREIFEAYSRGRRRRT